MSGFCGTSSTIINQILNFKIPCLYDLFSKKSTNTILYKFFEYWMYLDGFKCFLILPYNYRTNFVYLSIIKNIQNDGNN